MGCRDVSLLGMASLTKEQWAKVRTEWQASEKSGFEWLTLKGGGRWDVSHEPIRRRMRREQWRKGGQNYALLSVGGKILHGDADRVSVARIVAEAKADPGATPFGDGESERGDEIGEPSEPVMPTRPQRQMAALEVAANDADLMRDLRNETMDLHRKEWKLGRRLLYGAFEAARAAEDLAGLKVANLKMRIAKTGLESLTMLHTGETRAWGLEADLLDYASMTDAQLLAVSKGRSPR